MNAALKSPRSIGNLLAAILFGSVGLVQIMAGQYLDSGVWLALAGAMAASGSEATPWAKMTGWRKALGCAFLFAAAALFAARVYVDFTT